MSEKTAFPGPLGAWRRVNPSPARMFALAAIAAGILAPPVFVRSSAAAQSNAAEKSENSSASTVARGEKLYVSYGCYECHGRAAQGGGAGPKLGPHPLPLPSFEQYTHHPTGSMPPYTGKTVSDQDLADIYAYLKSLPEPPNENDIPILNE